MSRKSAAARKRWKKLDRERRRVRRQAEEAERAILAEAQQPFLLLSDWYVTPPTTRTFYR
jgi:hypothetical protein